MEYTTIEIALIQEKGVEASEARRRELTELQLTLSAGGMGDVVAM